jgi:hypothetical protein
MRRGACLHRYHEFGRIVWRLSTNDKPITPEAAADAIASGLVVSVGDALGDWGPAQTYRWTD